MELVFFFFFFFAGSVSCCCIRWVEVFCALPSVSMQLMRLNRKSLESNPAPSPAVSLGNNDNDDYNQPAGPPETARPVASPVGRGAPPLPVPAERDGEAAERPAIQAEQGENAQLRAREGGVGAHPEAEPEKRTAQPDHHMGQ